MKIQPFGDRVVVKLIPMEETTEGGLLLAPTSINNSNRGEVVAVGEGITLPDGTVKPLTVQVGDIVVFSRGSGMEYKSSTEIFKIISYKEIFGKIVKGN